MAKGQRAKSGKEEVPMSEKRYMISDASKQVEVEAHVLRYWEDELKLDIPRNEMGHRYYTEKNIKLLKNIKYLKEQGFQLKAIKMILPDLQDADDSILDVVLKRKEELNNKVMEEEQLFTNASSSSDKQELTPSSQSSPIPSTIHTNGEKMQQFQVILTEVIVDAIRQNNKELEKRLGDQISDMVLKHIDYLVHAKEEREEMRFKKLDETIRAIQKERMESAVTSEIPYDKPVKKRKSLFNRKKK